MAEESDAERTEPASARRLEQAREEGDVPRSREIGTFAVLMTSGLMLWLTGNSIVQSLRHCLVSGLSLTKEQIFSPDVLVTRIMVDVMQVVIACAPTAGAVMLVALASPLAIGGWLFSAKSLSPNFGRMNPLRGLTNMVSLHALTELLKAIAKTLLVGGVAWMVMRSQRDAVLALALEPIRNGSAHMVDLLIVAFLMMVSGLGLVALIDGPYQVWHYADKLKMTRQEVIQESKESDGNPQVKGRIRQLQREMARRRMMAAVPTADVVVTNPTHFAVALKYQDGKMRAPQVVAKGADDVAAKIRELALEHKVAILEAPPLARALYKHAEIGDEIPPALYTAVAEVLAYVFQLRAWSKTGGNKPKKPTELEVPPQLDPLNPAAQSPDGETT
ncbi:MAG: flagellar type III secretion system protein FlhB [Burkholderiales bacterium]|nr:flagellar type III secretion system protein FlhB [Burkholderiales bacterium]